MEKKPTVKTEDAANYFKNAASWDHDMLTRAKKSEKTAWVIAVIAITMAFIAVAAVAMLSPLKSVSPYLIEVEKNTGHVEVLSTLSEKQISEQEAIARSSIASYLYARETYNMHSRRALYDKSILLSSPEVADKLRDLYRSKDSPTEKWGEVIEVQAKIINISFLSDNLKEPMLAQVRFTRSIQEPQKDPKIENWLATISYVFDSKMKLDENERLENPLGFKILRYDLTPETLGK